MVLWVVFVVVVHHNYVSDRRTRMQIGLSWGTLDCVNEEVFLRKRVHLIWRREGGIGVRALEICIDSAGVVRLIKLIPNFGRDVSAEFGVQLYLELDHFELVRAQSSSRFSTSSKSHP